MKEATLERAIDDLGRVVIPKEIRNSLELNAGSRLSIHTYGASIILSAATQKGNAEPQKAETVLPALLMKEISDAVARLNSEDVLAWVDMLRRMARVAG